MIVLLILSCSGCATYYARHEEKSWNFFQKMGVYPATRLDIDFISIKEPLPSLLVTLDLPFSLALDTLLLPYDFYKDSINLCNNKTYENEIRKFILDNNTNSKINEVIITQIHMKYDDILAEYRFNCCADTTVTLFERESDGSLRKGRTISHASEGGSREVIINHLKTHQPKYLHNMIDCYK